MITPLRRPRVPCGTHAVQDAVHRRLLRLFTSMAAAVRASTANDGKAVLGDLIEIVRRKSARKPGGGRTRGLAKGDVSLGGRHPESRRRPTGCRGAAASLGDATPVPDRPAPNGNAGASWRQRRHAAGDPGGGGEC
jgi:hypothetical protein